MIESVNTINIPTRRELSESGKVIFFTILPIGNRKNPASSNLGSRKLSGKASKSIIIGKYDVPSIKAAPKILKIFKCTLSRLLKKPPLPRIVIHPIALIYPGINNGSSPSRIKIFLFGKSVFPTKNAYGTPNNNAIANDKTAKNKLFFKRCNDLIENAEKEAEARFVRIAIIGSSVMKKKIPKKIQFLLFTLRISL